MPRVSNRTHRQLEAADYKAVFEDHPTGALIFEALIQRFGRRQKGEGLDRVLNSFEFTGRREVLDYIADQINRANGVDPNQEDQQS